MWNSWYTYFWWFMYAFSRVIAFWFCHIGVPVWMMCSHLHVYHFLLKDKLSSSPVMPDSWRAHPLMCVLDPLPSQQGVVGSRAKRVIPWWRDGAKIDFSGLSIGLIGSAPRERCLEKKVPGEKLQRLLLRIWIQMFEVSNNRHGLRKEITATKPGDSCFKVIQVIANCNGKLGC